MGGKDEMTKASSSLQDLRRGIYVKAKAEPSWRFWGLYVHVCKMETLREAYALARKNNGASGIDGVTFEVIEEQGVEAFLEQIQSELVERAYVPLRARRQEIPKDGGKVRVLSIPAIRDRVVQGALKLILEPIFEADFQPGSYGYRPKRTAHEAVHRVATAIVQWKTRVIDLDLRAYFDTVRHHLLLEKVARRVNDDEVMRLLKLMLTASGKQGVPQGGVISPLLSNVYLTEVDRMLERAKDATRNGKYTYVEYVRFADDLVVLIDAHPRHAWLLGAVTKRLREEFAKLQVEVNEEKSRTVDLDRAESFGFLGFDFRRLRSVKRHVWRAHYTPKLKKRTALLRKLKGVFRRYQSQPVDRVVELINPVLRGWVNYFAVGHSSECFSFIKDWVEKKIRRHMGRSRNRRGFGWKKWSRRWLYEDLKLFNGYRVRRTAVPKASPA
ncbi:RNA-directed DNA polymerase [Paraburkholderia terricola]|uniref:group II intron reverse transcriptase/maturase n=1 Tax=Paraburkholderia terricola TaxID=169427 RepID=UPI0028563DAB|nr:group II intron reverse transcriptase/maturase [Paraburkholderia terricola]MDR6496800.1 RNA-directed DNA polymerase [Paraburkholderia terricola]